MNTFINILKNYDILLASQSQRRINLLKSLNLNFKAIPANINENIELKLSPAKYAQTLALKKANKVKKEILKNTETPTLIIGADTIVVLNNKTINKPKNEDEAFQMLIKLSNTYHFVYTGIALINTKNKKIITDYSRTCVYFRKLEENEILEYISGGKTLDKAGSYGIQDDYGSLFVKKIEGCYNNVIGLPIELLRRKLIEITKI